MLAELTTAPVPCFLPSSLPPRLQLTTLQKMVQQTGSMRSEASMSPVSSLRTSAAASMTPSLPPAAPELHQFRPQQAQQQQAASGSGSGAGPSVGDPRGAFWGLTRAVDCFRWAGGQAGGKVTGGRLFLCASAGRDLLRLHPA